MGLTLDTASVDTFHYELDVAQAVEYFHIELDTHNVLFAEGAASETYIEEASRNMFDNFDDYVARFVSDDHQHPAYCAPRISEGWELEAIRVRLLRRARALTHVPGTYLPRNEILQVATGQ